MKTHLLRLFSISTLFSLSLVAQGQIVSSGADDGSEGTLRKEIADTPEGGTILFLPTVNTIFLAGEIAINKDLNIQGNIGLTLHGNNANRIFNIDDAEVSITNLLLTNGVADNGGALLVNNATLNLTDVTIENSVANGASGSGGAVLVSGSGVLNVTRGSMNNNRANRAGGAIEVNSTAELGLVLNGVNFDDNNAGVSPAMAAPGNGGAVHITGATNSEITGGTLTGNRAQAEGGGLWNGTGTMTVLLTNFQENEARGNESNQGGGALFNAGGTLNINGSDINNNTATGTAGSGGGILNDLGVLSVTNSSFESNTAVRAGGAIEDNSAEGNTLTLSNVSFVENEASSSPGNGGGLHITGPGNSIISGIEAEGNIAAAEGGALWNGTGLMTVSDADFTSNVASGAGADQGGGALFNAGGTLVVDNAQINGNNADGAAGSGGGILSDKGVLIVSNSTFTGNTSLRAGGGIEVNSAGGLQDSIVACVFTQNTTGGAPGNGGAIHITGSDNMVIQDSEARNNSAAKQGGAFWNGAGIMEIENTEISENTATGNDANTGGGGLYNLAGVMQLNEVTVEDNLATGTAGSGGGLLIATGEVNITNSDFANNGANRAGGAIEIIDGTLLVEDATFTGNNVNGLAGTPAPGSGGALHVTGNATMVTFKRTIVEENEAANTGGGLWNQSGSTLNVEESAVTGNTANGGGGLDGLHLRRRRHR